MNLLDLFVRISAKNEASGEIDSISNDIIGKLGNAAKTAAGALAALWTGNKVVEFGKQAFYAYSQFEQLQGGVAKLYGNAGMEIEEYAQSVGKAVDEVQADYERNARAQEMVMENAQNAWKSAGMDANTYMQTATSFSAALINSLGGDTEEAARLTDEAMVAMSDNVNTFGSDMSSVQNAFQGFAKQNWMMLDNLKLGYGGTKAEMERLIADASQMTEEQEQLNMTVDGSSLAFDNVVKAIQVVQKHQGIYGTTTKEAMNTIEGSMNATKAAWSNLVAEIGKPDADLGARMQDLATAILGQNGEGGLLKNVVTTVGRIVTNVTTGIGNLVGQSADWLAQNGAKMLRDGIDRMVEGAANFGDLVKNLPKVNLGEALFSEDGGALSGIGNLITNATEIIRESWPDIQGAVGETWDNIRNLVIEYGPQVLEAIGTILSGVGEWIITNTPDIVGSIYETFLAINEWIVSNGPMILEALGGVLESVVMWLWEHAPDILAAVGETLMNIVTAIAEHGPTILASLAEMVGTAVAYLLEHAVDFLDAAGEWITSMLQSIEENGIQIPDWFSGLPQRILDALGDLSGFLVNAGKQIIDGFFAGLKDSWSAVTDWVGGLGDWIAEHKGPKAYDLGLLVPNGQWIMQGLEDGLMKGLPSVQKTIADVTDSIQGGMEANVSLNGTKNAKQPDVIGALNEIRDNMNMQVYLDGKTLVGGIAPTMNAALGGME